MRKRIAKRMICLILSLLICLSIGSTVSAFADDTEIVLGPTVKKDPDSPTGYTVTFVYYNPNATRVQLAGDLTLMDINGPSGTRYQPEQWQPGRYHCGGTEFKREMTRDENGYWSVSIPMHAGGLSYWYRVWDETQNWENKRIWDPACTHPRPDGTTTFRVRNNNDVLDVVYVPYDEKQNDPVLESRARYELPMADPAKRGTVQYIPYTTILGDDGFYLGVYLPPGYDPNREEPYKVMYLAHGIFGDETDFMIPINAPNIMDNLIARGEVEPTVLVTMGNHFTGSSLSFSSYNQQNAVENLVNVIIPKIEAEFNVSREPEGRAYAGFSYGGMTGGILMRNYADKFGYYGFFSGNGSFSAQDYDNIARKVGDNVPFVFLGNGSFEGSLNACNTIRDNFRARGIPSETAQVPGAHDGMTCGQLFTIFARDYLWETHSHKLNITSNADLVKKGDYFDIAVSFKKVTSTNAVSVVLSYDQDKFEYAGNLSADRSQDSYIDGVTYLTTDVGDGSVRLTMMIPDYKAKDLVSLRFRAKENADIRNADNLFTATADFVYKTYEGQKSLASASSSINITTVADPGDTDGDGLVTLLDLSNIIDMFGVKIGDELWSEARFFDFNGNKEIDIADIVAVARLIG